MRAEIAAGELDAGEDKLHAEDEAREGEGRGLQGLFGALGEFNGGDEVGGRGGDDDAGEEGDDWRSVSRQGKCLGFGSALLISWQGVERSPGEPL